MTWSKLPVDREMVKQVAARFRCDSLTASILIRRSYDSPSAARFFLEDDEAFLHNPFLMGDMEAAVDRIRTAAAGAEPIFLFGDRDVDGVTSIELLRQSLTEMGATVSYGMPEGDDEYGLSEKWVRRMHESGTRLIVTVDCGISSSREVALAAELGMDCIVTDHHNPPEELPTCVAILNPKIGESSYPFRDLSGCGVAWKLDWALCYSRSVDFGRETVLLDARPANDTLAVDAVRVRNMRVLDSLSDVLLPGMVPYAGSRLQRFIADTEVAAYDAEQTLQGLARAFDGGFPVPLRELKSELWAAFPDLRDRSLLRLLESSKAARYSERPLREVDLLADLYAGLARERCRELLEPARGRLDLVALGTLSDLMTLRDENRILVRKGMRMLSSSPRNGLRELLASGELLGKRLSTRDIAWKITPVLNAAGRMGQPGAALDLLLSSTMERAAAQAELLLDLNKRRKALGDKVWDECRGDAEASLARTGGRILLVSGPRIHWGITGILAARLAGAFKVPAVVVAEQPVRCVGSVRSPAGFSIAGFLEMFDDLLAGYGGHDFAAGFNLGREKLEAFRDRFYEVARDVVIQAARAESIAVDAEIPPAYLGPMIMEVIDRFEPYGEGNPPLTFLTRGLEIESIDLVGRPNGSTGAPHARLLLAAGKHRWPAVYWNGADRIRAGLTLHDRVDVVYRVERNHFMGMDTPRLNVVDMGS